MKIKNEKNVFELYCDESSIRPILQRPFRNTYDKGYIWASDGHSLLIVKENVVSGIYEESSLRWNETVDTDKFNCNTILTQEAVLKALMDCPQVEEEICVGKNEECKECDGTGEVEWVYTDSCGKTHWHDFDCPACDGSGYEEQTRYIKTGKMIADDEASIKIDTGLFAALQIRRLYETMKLLDIDEVRHRITAKAKANLFVVNDDIRIVIMPFKRDDICVTLKTKKGGK